MAAGNPPDLNKEGDNDAAQDRKDNNDKVDGPAAWTHYKHVRRGHHAQTHV